MRQLLLVLLIFVLSLLGLVAVFNTITNTSKQSNIVLATDLPNYPKAEQHLIQALKWCSSNDSTGHSQMKSFYTWIQQEYPLLFDNPNIEWKEFGPSNWVAKWVGRKADLAPIVWMASPQVTCPTAKESGVPFAGNLPPSDIYGQGSKAVMIAMLEVLHDLVTKERLPDRTIYFAFPFPNKTGGLQILTALAQAGTSAEYILQTGGFIAQDLLWGISSPVALLGIGQLAKAQITLSKPPNMDWNFFLERLQSSLPTTNLNHNVARQLLEQLSPELPFQQCFIFSNPWLLNWNKKSYFPMGSLPQSLVGISAQLSPAYPNSDTALLQITAPQLKKENLTSILQFLSEYSITTLGDWMWQPETPTAYTESRSYRLLGNTCKEIFPDLITAPIWITPTNTTLIPPTIQTPVFYFHPIVRDSTSWEKAQGGAEHIKRQNYQRLLHFYYQLLNNSI